MFKRYRSLIFASLTLLGTCHLASADPVTYFVDSSRSQYQYVSSPWFDSSCRTGCEFQLSGSFDGVSGGQTMTITNANLTISGHHEDAAPDASIVNRQFPRSAVLSQSIPNTDPAATAFLGGPVIRWQDGDLRLFAGRNSTFVDGDAYFFDVTAFGSNELDCNGNGIVDFEDISCRENPNKISTILDVSNTLPGDTDGDGAVGFIDFLVVSKNFGLPGHYGAGDLDLSGDIGFSDFLIVSANFDSASQAAAVPEPAAVWLAMAAGVSLLLLRRRR